MTFNADNTLLEDFAKCEAAGIVRHVFGLRGLKEKVAADIGNAYHAALEGHFMGREKRSVVEIFEGEYDKIIPPGEQPEEERFARINCIKILERFCDTRPVDGFPFEPVSFEEIKGVPIDENGDYVFWAKRDMLVREKATGAYAVVDHKTTQRITDWFARRFRLTSQLTGYVWLTSEEMKQAVTTAYVNGIEVAKLPDSSRKCTKHSTPGNPKKFIECSAEHANFQLFQYIRKPEQIAKWKQDALIGMKRAEFMKGAFGHDLGLVKYAMRNGAFNGNCMFCEFADWCAGDFEVGLAGDYTVLEKWGPWDSGSVVGEGMPTAQE